MDNNTARVVEVKVSENQVVEDQSPIHAEALREWRAVLGARGLATDAGTIERYGRSCGYVTRRATAVLWPTSRDQVVQIVRIASQYAVPLYCLSAGKNWGYGTTIPCSAGNVIVDLSRMNKILELNEQLAYVVVEPGVTQQQLYDYIVSRSLPLTFDVTGSSPMASLIGNLSERGSGPTRYADHFQHSAGMEVVLSDGTVLNTGFGHIPDSRVSSLYKWGVGPYLDGIFTQSNFGIITKITIWLLPKPKNFSLLLMTFESDAQLGDAIERLRALKLSGNIPAAIHVANDLRVISVLQNSPLGVGRGAACLTDRERESLQKKWGVGAWNLLASLEGSRAQIRANLAEVRRALKGITSVRCCSESTVALCARFPIIGTLIGQPDLRKKLSILRLMKGVPSEVALRGTYWRKPRIPDSVSDPLDHGCGILWCAPIVPMTKPDIERFLHATRAICSAHRIDTNIGVTLLTERACCCTIGIIFDKESTDETLSAQQLYQELLSKLLELGYPPYRLSSATERSSEVVFAKSDSFLEVCHRLKRALDPAGILAPGKYGVF